jgi:hypothetical protein
LDGSTGVLSGTPSGADDSIFDIEVSDANGHSTTKIFRVCVMEIVTDSTLPDATVGGPYTMPLVQDPAVVSSEVWTLVGGTLPAGLTLNAVGSITGTPHALDDPSVADFTFTIQCVATCGTGQVTCQKRFDLHINSVDCMGAPDEIQDATWNDVSLAGCSFTMLVGNGTFTGVPTPTTQCQIAGNAFCNSSLEAYDLTMQWDWTGVGYTVGVANATRVIFRIDGIDVNFSPFFNANGTFSHTQIVSMPSGVHTLALRIVCTAGGQFLRRRFRDVHDPTFNPSIA